MIKTLNALILIAVLILMGSCMRKVSIPQEGDVVTWYEGPALIIKTKLGQRREHIPNLGCDKCEANYEPHYERFIGQFPINYVPERFPKFTEAELADYIAKWKAKKTPRYLSMHPLEFNLMLNGVTAKATDKGFESSKTLDNVNQVKVQLWGAGNTKRSATWYELFKSKNVGVYDEAMSLKEGMNCYSTKDQGSECYAKDRYENSSVGLTYTKAASLEMLHKRDIGVYDEESSAKYGMECYAMKNPELLDCYGKSSYQEGAVAICSVFSAASVRCSSREPIYDGIEVNYRLVLSQLKHWKAIDAAIWRLLESWNVSPLQTIDPTVK